MGHNAMSHSSWPGDDVKINNQEDKEYAHAIAYPIETICFRSSIQKSYSKSSF